MEKAENKKEYLKKYLSGSDKKKKKKKIISSSSSLTKSKIIDDDFDLKKLRPLGHNELDIYDMNEDAPQVVGIVDDRPDDVQLIAQFRETKKWKVITREYEDVEIAPILDRGSDTSPKHKQSQEKIKNIKKRRNSSDSDASAPRKNSSISGPKKNANYDSDESPPRKSDKKGNDGRDGKRIRAGNDSDVSPPRKKNQKQYDSDASPPRKKNQKQYDSDVSPPRKKNQKQYDSDVSPPRNRKRRDSDASPPRNRKRRDSDASPPRNRKPRDSDVSPPRNRKRRDSDVSPPRNRKPRDSDSDLSPRRPNRPDRRQSDRRSRDRSPPRRNHREDSRRWDSDRRRDDKSNKTLEGKRAGLQNLDEMKKEAAELRRKQQDSLAKLGDDVSGRGAATIVRDRRTGRKKDFREEAKQKREKEERDAELQEKYLVWGKGLKQVDDKATKMREEEHEMTKPLARYANDADLEELQKNQEREGDPMLDYFREKKRKEGRGGPVKQLFQGNFMPNRYGIRPGPKWDGVDRSSGYEKKWFEEQNRRRAVQDDSYKWSTEDM